MPARTIEQQQNATCFSVVVICLIIAIVSNVNYLKTDSETVKNRCKNWFIPCYSIAGVFTFIQLLKTCCQYKKNNNNIVISVPV